MASYNFYDRVGPVWVVAPGGTPTYTTPYSSPPLHTATDGTQKTFLFAVLLQSICWAAQRDSEMIVEYKVSCYDVFYGELGLVRDGPGLHVYEAL